MKSFFVSVIIVLSMAPFSFCQNPNIIWQKTIGGSNWDVLNTITPTSEGGYLLGGTSDSDISGEKNENSRGGIDYWIVKLNNLGAIEWQKTIGGGDADGLEKIIQTNDGGFLLGGGSNSNISGEKSENSRGLTDYWIIKINSLGSIEWQKTIGGILSDNLTALAQAPDGNYFVGGFSNSPISGEKTEDSVQDDYWVLKLNNTGNIIWQNTIGGDFEDHLYSLYPTIDGGCIIGGESNSNISGDKTENAMDQFGDYWVLKLDLSGQIEWQNTIGGTAGDRVTSLLQTKDGNYLVAGSSASDISGDKTENSEGLSDYWVMKLNSIGEILWQNTIGGSEFDFLNCVTQSTNGTYLLGGYSWSDISGDKTEDSNGMHDYWVLVIEEGGTITSQITLGGEKLDFLSSALITNSNTIIVGGQSKSDISGDKTENSRGDFDYWVLEVDNILDIPENEFFNSIKIFPNPAKSTVQIKIKNQKIDMVKIFSIKGQLIQEINPIEKTPIIDISTFPQGVYYLQISLGKKIITKNFIKE